MNISALDLKNSFEKTYCNEFGGPLKYLPNVKHINILVGENNSGKSRFCRELINSTDITILTDESYFNNPDQINNIRKQIKHSFESIKEIIPEAVISATHDLMTACELFVFYQNQYEHLDLNNRNVNQMYRTQVATIENSLKTLKRTITSNETRSLRETLLIKGNSNAYIPVLRGIENLDLYFNIRNSQQLDSINMNAAQRNALAEYKSNAGIIYKNKICKAYNMSRSVVFTGENLYSEIRDKLLGHEDGRAFIRDFERFISEHFFDNEGFNIIPIIKEGYLNVKIGNNTERPLYDLGDGIKQIICILYKVFEYKDDNGVIIIEEPELNLHTSYVGENYMDVVEDLNDAGFYNIEIL